MGGSEEEAVRWDLIHEESNALCGPIAGSRHCKECEVKERRVVDRKKAEEVNVCDGNGAFSKQSQGIDSSHLRLPHRRRLRKSYMGNYLRNCPTRKSKKLHMIKL